MAQKVTKLQIAGGWGSVVGGCFTTCFLLLPYSSHSIFWSLFSAECLTRWTLDPAQHGSSDVLHTFCQPLNLHYRTSATELQTFTAHSDFRLTSVGKCFRHKKQALFWTHYGEDSHCPIPNTSVRHVAQQWFSAAFPLQQWSGEVLSCTPSWAGLWSAGQPKTPHGSTSLFIG